VESSRSFGLGSQARLWDIAGVNAGIPKGAVLVGGLAFFLGGLFSMMLGGFGFCAARLSVTSVGGGLVAAVSLAWVGAVALRTRWLTVILFSVPMALGFVLAAAAQRWGRCGAILACIVASITVVAMARFDHRKHDRPAP
jgi:hypothetical protein